MDLVLIHGAKHLRTENHGGCSGRILRLRRWQRRRAGCVVLVASISVGPLAVRVVRRIQISRFRYVTMGHGLVRSGPGRRWNAIIVLVCLCGIWKNCGIRLVRNEILHEDGITNLQGDYNWDVLPLGMGRSHRRKEVSFEVVNSC